MLRGLFVIVSFAIASFSYGQAFPTKPLRMLVGFAPGGANDILARIVAQKLSGSFGQPVVVDNRPGNAGLIATELLAKAPPDGYTLLLGSTGTNSMAPHLTTK